MKKIIGSRVWNMRIGLEIHAQIITSSKLFSAASVGTARSSPNSCVSLFDAATPGTLPCLNREAVNQAIRAASALGCSINKDSYFERKHYCYQDLPLGYQITQQARPIAEGGRLEFDVLKEGKFTHRASVGINRVQLEQDSGKSLYNAHHKYTLVDLNRAGTALLEIVFDPDLRSPEEAASALRAMQKLMRHINICDGNMQNGSMRCDVNISVEGHWDGAGDGLGETLVGGRVEVKNINSMQSVASAARFEADRHISILESGAQIPRETRGFDAATDTTYRMRSKETAVDYRIFRDPDLPPLRLTDEDLSVALSFASESLDATAERLTAKYGLNEIQVDMLVTHQALQYFESTMLATQSDESDAGPSVTNVYNWVFGDLLGNLNNFRHTFAECTVTPDQLAGIIKMVERGKISGPQAKTLLKDLFSEANTGLSPEALVAQYGWEVISDSASIGDLVNSVINNPKNEKQLRKLLSGNTRIAKFFFGEVMKISRGQVDPKALVEVLDDALAVRAAQEGSHVPKASK